MLNNQVLNDHRNVASPIAIIDGAFPIRLTGSISEGGAPPAELADLFKVLGSCGSSDDEFGSHDDAGIDLSSSPTYHPDAGLDGSRSPAQMRVLVHLEEHVVTEQPEAIELARTRFDQLTNRMEGESTLDPEELSMLAGCLNSLHTQGSSVTCFDISFFSIASCVEMLTAKLLVESLQC